MHAAIQPGDVFHRLTVTGRSERRGYVICKCVCGTEKVVRADHLRGGRTQSCGCLHSERASERANRNLGPVRTKHGQSDTPAHTSWLGMKQRCTNPNAVHYDRYGGRGITVCDRWLNSFETFLSDMGQPPPGHTLDRIDNSGHYEPNNCRWVPRTVQGNNREINRRITYQGTTATISQWARALGLHRNTLNERLGAGWTVERAFNEAPDRSKPAISHCKRGHPFVEGSYYLLKSGSRACKECFKVRARSG